MALYNGKYFIFVNFFFRLFHLLIHYILLVCHFFFVSFTLYFNIFIPISLGYDIFVPLAFGFGFWALVFLFQLLWGMIFSFLLLSIALDFGISFLLVWDTIFLISFLLSFVLGLQFFFWHLIFISFHFNFFFVLKCNSCHWLINCLANQKIYLLSKIKFIIINKVLKNERKKNFFSLR